MNFDIWNRDDKGELIPRDGTVEFTGNALEKVIKIQKNKLSLEKDDDRAKVISRAIELLQESFDKKKEEFEIKFIPLLDFQIKHAVNNLDCEGNKTEDLEASICTKCCIDPKRTFEEWRDLKDSDIKKNVSNFIFVKSFPEKIEKSEEEKEAFQMLLKLA